MTTTGAFYEPGGAQTYLPTEHTEGPWDPRHQHGGPPAALLTRAVERELTGTGLRVARMSIDILGPVPREPMRLTTSVQRPGRRVRLLRAVLAGEQTLMTATAWAIRPAPDDCPSTADPPAGQVPAGPVSGSPDEVPEQDPATVPGYRCGFLSATEWRFVRGAYGSYGPATAWTRSRVPLLPGEPMSALQRVALTADSANGISAVLPVDGWLFVPTELTLHIVRPPDGEWLRMDASSWVRPGEVGLATSVLYDRHGLVATSAQSMLVAAR